MAKHAAETADAIVRTVLTLFGGDGTGEGFYRGEPYEIPGDDQLRLTGTEMGYGNRLPTQDAFSTDTTLYCPVGNAVPESAREKRIYSFACSPCDRIYAAVQVIFALHLRRGVRKCVVAVRSLVEREQIRQAMEVYTAHFAEQYRLATPVIRVYDSADRDGLRGYLTAEGIGILLINRENFDRDANLLRRQSAEFSDRTPLSLLQKAHPLVVTLTNAGKPLERLLTHTAQFAPLCTLAFTEKPDRTGTTYPVYIGTSRAAPEETDGQLRLGE